MATEKLNKAFYEKASGLRLGVKGLAKAAGVAESVAKKFLEKQEIAQIYKKMPRQSVGPSYDVPKVNIVHQADLLQLPKDGEHGYALVVVDVHSRKVDAEPLKNKKASTVLDALKAIYKRHAAGQPLGDLPEKLSVDQGPEFKGPADKFFKDNRIFVVRAEKGRHRAQAFAEAANKEIGGTLLKRMQAQELLTGERSIEWVEDLPDLIAEMNKRRKPLPKKKFTMPRSDRQPLLKEGTKVRIALEHPVNALTGEQLHGNFRASDPRWTTATHTVEQLYLKPGQPPMYKVSGKQHMYPRNRLQPVGEAVAPQPSVIRGKPSTYVVEALVDKRKEKGKIQYKVKWRGYPDSESTWESRATLIQDVPEMVAEYEKSKK